jgi:hypothetical protein
VPGLLLPGPGNVKAPGAVPDFQPQPRYSFLTLYADVILNQRPNMYLRCEETSGTTAFDKTGRGHDGTYAGTFTLGRKGGTYDALGNSVFVQTDGRITTNYNPFINGQDFSFSGLVYLNANSQCSIFGGDNASTGPNFRIESGTPLTNVSFDPVSSNTFPAVYPGAFQWVLIGISWLGSAPSGSRVATLYINGVQAGQVTGSTGSWSASPGNFEAGCRRGTGVPMNGFMNEYAVWERLLSADEFAQQWDAIDPSKDTFGGVAVRPLSVKPPDTTGYTVRTITPEECQSDSSRLSHSVLDIVLNDTVDYIVKCNYPLRRGIRINGGRNIVYKGAHSKIDLFNRFNTPSPALVILDGAAAVDGRIVHLEGFWIEGSELGEGIDLICPKANVRLCNFLVENPHFRSSDEFVQTLAYQGGGNHPDGIQTFGDFKSLTIDTATFTYSVTALHFDQSSSSKTRLRNVNTRAVPFITTEDTPYTDVLAWAPGTTRFDFEASLGAWAAAGGSTVTRDTATPVAGVGSMKLTQTTTTKNIFAATSGLGGVDYSSGNGLAFTARLDAGGGAHPMIRLDVATDSAASATADSVGWHKGKTRKLITGTPVTVFSDFPPNIMQAIQKLRIVLLTDGTNTAHTVMIDDIAEGTGSILNIFTGTPQVWEGYWGLYHNDATAGEVDINGLWSEGRANGLFVNNASYNNRYWDGASYVNDPPPGNATLKDTILGAGGVGVPDVAGTDDVGSYVSFSTLGDLRDSSGTTQGKIYQGPPPGGDFVTNAVAGVLYASPSYVQVIDLIPATESDTAQALNVDKKVAVVPATETDTAVALSLSGAHHVTLTPATETDTAQALNVDKLRALTPATETDAGQALNVDKKLAVTPATETDVAQAANVDKKRALTVATEADAAQALNVDKKLSVTPATETDAAQTLAVRKVHDVFLTPATETDTAQALNVDKARTLVPAVETDVAQATNVDKKLALAPAAETDSAQALNVDKKLALLRALETDTAQAITHGRLFHLTPATETDTTQATNVDKHVTLTPAVEVDTPVNLSIPGIHHINLTPATETDSAQALNVDKKRSLVPATETDSAQAITKRKVIVLTAAPETDVARALFIAKHLAVAFATETDVARAVTRAKRVTLVPAAEVDTVVGHQRVSLVAALETDEAQILTVFISGRKWPASTDARWSSTNENRWTTANESRW